MANECRDAYEGAREDLLHWKRRAQVAEAHIAELESRLATGEPEPAGILEVDAQGAFECLWQPWTDRLHEGEHKLYTHPPAQPPAAQVPDEVCYDHTFPGEIMPARHEYVDGWNACRAAMLATQPQKPVAQVPDGRCRTVFCPSEARPCPCFP